MRLMTFTLSLTAIAGIVSVNPVDEQDEPARTSLIKSGFLGLGVEPGLCSKWPLLETPSVMKELKLSEAQLDGLKRAKAEASRISERVSRENRMLRDRLTAQGDREALAEFGRAQRNRLYALTREHDQPLLKVLDDAQRARLEQIQLRADGPMAFVRPAIQERLRMSPEQVELITAICQRGNESAIESARLPVVSKLNPVGLSFQKRTELLKSKAFEAQVEGVREQVASTHDSTMREIGGHLTKRQRAMFDKMLGERFDSPKMMEKRDSGSAAAQTAKPPNSADQESKASGEHPSEKNEKKERKGDGPE
jgi:hypothetical protein